MEFDPGDRLGYQLWRAHHDYRHGLETKLARLRLNLPQFGAMAHLAAQPGLSAAGLARLLPLTPQAASNLVARLEAADYLTRAAPTAGRNQALTLTATGHAALADAVALADAQEDSFFGPLDDDERAQLQKLLIRCQQSTPDPGRTR